MNPKATQILNALNETSSNLAAAATRARTTAAATALASAASEIDEAMDFLLRGVNGSANIRLTNAHLWLTPLRTRASRAAIHQIKELGLL